MFQSSFNLVLGLDCEGFVDWSGGVNWGRGKVCGSGDGVILFCRGSVCGSSELVSRSGVGGSFVVGCDVFGVLGFTGVLDVGSVTVVVGLVGDNLGAPSGRTTRYDPVTTLPSLFSECS